MGRHLDKFLLLMWKNCLLQWRHPIQTVMEILSPVLFALLLVLIRSLVDPEDLGPINFPTFDNNFEAKQEKLVLPWSPQNDVLETIMTETVTSIIQRNYLLKDRVAHKALESRQKLDQYLSNEMYLNESWAGIDFGDDLADKNDLPKNMTIVIRYPGELRVKHLLFPTWTTHRLFPVYETAGPRLPKNLKGGYPGYEDEGFLLLQKHLSYSIINYFKNRVYKTEFKKETAPIYMQRFSYSAWTEDVLIQALQSFVGLLFMLAFSYTCTSTVKVITTEKEKQLKEAMKIMGLPCWLHWTAWFIKTFIFLLISVILMIVLLKVPWYAGTTHSVFTYSDAFVIFIFLVLYISATTTFCFAISVFFSKANTAAMVAGIAWFVSYFPYFLMQESYENLSLSQKLSTSLLANTAMAYGFQLILMFEGNEGGLQWNNIWTASPDDNLVFGHILIILLIDTILYLLIALYVEAIFPGEYGVPEVWYFPFTKSYWCGKSVTNCEVLQDERISKSEHYEEEPYNLKIGIKARKLRKEFKDKVAVQNLSLNMYQDQITVLLGHNGAGKTTTMSMLTGMFPPSSGTAIVNDCDILTNMNGVRESLGLCPQHNILFDELTVSEHIYFYSRLKGMSTKLIKSEIQKYLDLLELRDKADAKSSTLSGGMKRKLSVAVSLCGNSKVVMCDEPTAGMDPSARRALWDLLQSQKKGRTILLTTHYMDEADLLGDRIAIMAEGELQCCGSSFFLKKKYGAGYRLIMDISRSCKPDEVTELLQKYIQSLQIESNIGSELTYTLKEEYSSVFERMLFDLETHSQELGVNSFGISLTTLEEVFMKVGASPGSFDENSKVTNGHQNRKQEIHNHDSKVQIGYALHKGWPLWRNQVGAMFMKKGLSLIRSWILLLIQNIMPVSFLIFAVIALRNKSKNNNLPSLKIDLQSYREPVTVVTHDKENIYATAFFNVLKKFKGEVLDWKDGNMNELIIKETAEKTSTVRSQYIIGANFAKPINDTNPIIAFFNNNPLHSPPLALQMTINAILQEEVSPDHWIQIYNHPLPYTANTLLTELSRASTSGFGIAFNLAFSMAFCSAFYIMFYIRERVSKSKHLQFVSGIKVLPFWCTSFITDLITYIITTLLIIVTFSIIQEDGFRTTKDLGNVFLIFVYFGISVIPMMYLASYLFDVPSTGFTRMSLFNVLAGVAGILGVQILAQPELELENLADVLHWILLFIPQYAFGAGLRDTNVIFTTQHICKKTVQACVDSGVANKLFCIKYSCTINEKCCTQTTNYYDMERPGIGTNILISCCMSILFFVILFAIEFNFFRKIRDILLRKLPDSTAEANEDDDVAKERKLIRTLSDNEMQQYEIVMRNVTKYYKNMLAVNSLCLGIKKQECFGLLGVNGAGKTTTFKMMTGDIPMSFGEAWVNGLNLKTDLKKVQKLIGYCPQFDALLDDLTARETLILYGIIRGMTINQSKLEAEFLAHEYDFTMHLDKQIKALSGGNKRKVSTALALIGNPQVIYLDEPTAGMDPATKRHLWNALCKVRDSGKCIVLTSHSMEECEALCTRLSIMVNGTFKCLGSTQHLKNKFSAGYTLIIKIKRQSDQATGNMKAIEQFVKQNFESAVTKEKHQDMMTFYITSKSQPWSAMFGILERTKQSLNIEDYSLGQSSLEQVFLTFTKHQRPEDS